jgi:hypothetical protein
VVKHSKKIKVFSLMQQSRKFFINTCRQSDSHPFPENLNAAFCLTIKFLFVFSPLTGIHAKWESQVMGFQ